MVKATRRGFITSVAATAGGIAAFRGIDSLASLASAQTPLGGPDRYYVFCYFSGGWDILLGLDPRDPIEFNNGNASSTGIQPGYELLRSTDEGPLTVPGTGDNNFITFGPHIGDLVNHVDKICVVRGMSMETLTHEAGRRRFLTGKVPSGLLARGSSGATWLASQLGSGEPIPNLAVRVESYNTELPKYATGLEVGAVPDLIRVLQPGQPQLDPRIEQQVAAFLSGEAGCTNPSRSALWQQAEASRLQASAFSSAGLDALFDFQANTPQMAALRDHYNIPSTGAAALQTPAAQAAIASRALMGGVSRCVSVQLASSLDTHYEQEWTRDQGPIQEEGFNAVSRLIEDLAASEYKGTGETWLDHTTIVGFSEFSRTSAINDRGGRDHSLTNACFVAGADIAGGTVVGASSNIGMTPTGVDLTTGQPVEGGEVPRPEHILQALYDLAGIGDTADLRVPALRAILKS